MDATVRTMSGNDGRFSFQIKTANGWCITKGGSMSGCRGSHTVTNEWEENRDALLSKENKVGTTEISRYEYSVNAIGQRTSLAATGSAFVAARSIGWSYNARGEVVSANHNESFFRRFYKYDAIGNRMESRTGSATNSGGMHTLYFPSPLNQYSMQIFTDVAGYGFPDVPTRNLDHSYDADGNTLETPLTSQQFSVRIATMKWDAENRMSAVSTEPYGGSSGTSHHSYRYDPFGRRIMKVGTGGPTGPASAVFVYDGWNLAAEYQPNSGNWALKTSYLFGQDLSGSLQGAGGVGGLLSVTDHGSLFPHL